MAAFSFLKRRLRPARLVAKAASLSNKLLRRVTRPEARLVTLAPVGRARGRALVSYIVDALLRAPERPLPHSHTHYWESRQIAWTLRDLGFTVDVIHWTNRSFVPSQRYQIALDVRLNLERWAVGDDCLRIQHCETAHHRFHNRAQRQRLAQLAERRGVSLRPVKLIEENRAIEHADFATTVGNDFTIGTYADAGKVFERIPISTPLLLNSPATKNFDLARKRFLWFGSAGLVHKGLDLVLEAFAGMPELELVVCGPVDGEPDFEREYERELYETKNIRTLGFIDVASRDFQELLSRTICVIYPSCSEGGGGSVIGCMHGGLIPVVTPETSVDVLDFGMLLPDVAVSTIQNTARELSQAPAADLRARSLAGFDHVRQHHCRERFVPASRQAFSAIIERWEKR